MSLNSDDFSDYSVQPMSLIAPDSLASPDNLAVDENVGPVPMEVSVQGVKLPPVFSSSKLKALEKATNDAGGSISQAKADIQIKALQEKLTEEQQNLHLLKKRKDFADGDRLSASG